jgi:hypothetical protein
VADVECHGSSQVTSDLADDGECAANRGEPAQSRSSTGPRSTSGKKRASQNAYRHGLTKPISSAEFAREVEMLAGQIAGDSEGKITIERAHDAAEAELEVARVRRVRTALIERVAALGRFDVPKRFQSPKDEVAWIMQRYWGATLWKGRPKFAVDPLPAMPSQEPQRTAEAVRRILPELCKLNRYESRAVTRRDRAIRAIMLSSKGR